MDPNIIQGTHNATLNTVVNYGSNNISFNSSMVDFGTNYSRFLYFERVDQIPSECIQILTDATCMVQHNANNFIKLSLVISALATMIIFITLIVINEEVIEKETIRLMKLMGLVFATITFLLLLSSYALPMVL